MHMLILLLSVAAGAAIVLVTHILNERRSTKKTDYEQIIADFIRVILPMETDCALFE